MKLELSMVNGDKFFFKDKDAEKVKQEIYFSNGNDFGLTDEIKTEDGNIYILRINNISSVVIFKEESK